MELRVLASVLWRFRAVVAIGIAASLLLALLTTFKVGTSGVSYRTENVWESHSLLLLTQQGFPWGRSTLSDMVEVERGDGKVDIQPRFADTPRYQGLALIYANLATSDEVRRLMLASGPVDGEFGAETVRSSDGQNYLPLLAIKAYASSAEGAQTLARRATDAFRAYLDAQQTTSGIPANQRVELPVVNAASEPELFEGRSISRPLFVFLLGVLMVVGLAFLLENLRPTRGVLTPQLNGHPPRREPAATSARDRYLSEELGLHRH